MPAPKQPRIIEQHDYLSLVLGSRRLTTSYGGVKATGDLPQPVVQLWWDLFAGNRPKPDALARIGLPQGGNVGERVKAFAANIDTIWPEWREEAPAPKIGATHAVDLGRRDGIRNGTIIAVMRQNAVVDFGNGLKISVPFSMLRPPIPNAVSA